MTPALPLEDLIDPDLLSGLLWAKQEAVMKRLIFAVCAAMALTACSFDDGTVHSAASAAAGAADAAGAKPPTPAAATVIDEQAVTLAAKAVDTVALSASALVRASVIQARSPAALKLADALDRARRSVNAAAAARRAGNAASYRAALTDAEAAIADVRRAIGG